MRKLRRWFRPKRLATSTRLRRVTAMGIAWRVLPRIRSFSVPHGYYSTTQSVAISTPTAGAIIVYTTNGSTPQVDANLNVTNGTLYTRPLTIGATTTVRARAFKLGFKPSFVSASTYIFVADVINQSPLGQVPPGWAANGVNGQSLDYGIDPDIIALYGASAVEQLVGVAAGDIDHARI